MAVVRVIDEFMRRTTRIQYSPYLLVLVPIIVGCIRAGEEAFLLYSDSDFGFVLHLCVGYLLFQVMMVTAVSLASGRSYREVTGAVSVGLVLGVLPPVPEFLLLRQPGRLYMYFTDFRWTFSSSSQQLGETVVIWMAIALAGVFVASLTRSVWRALAALVGAWVALQLCAWAWPALTLLVTTPPTPAPHRMNLVALVVVFAIYLAWNRKTMFASLLRFNHALPFGLLAAIGARMAGQPWKTATTKAAVMACAFMLSAFANDYFDRVQDSARGGTARPVSGDDLVIVLYFQVLLVVCVAFLEPRGAFVVVLFFALTTVYHLPGLRLKRLFCASYKIEGAAAASCFLFGLVGSSGFPRRHWVPLMTLVVFGGFALESMFKDYKDIEQDRSDHVGTIYTRYLARGHTLGRIHLTVGLATSLALIVPPVWLLTTAAPVAGAIALLVLAPWPALVLLKDSNRTRAVEATIWLLSGYLALLLGVVPAGR